MDINLNNRMGYDRYAGKKIKGLIDPEP